MGDSSNTFSLLVPYAARTFLSQDAVLTDVKAVAAIYEKLLAREVVSVQELEQWMLDRSELDAALSQAGSILYIEMTCATDDPVKSKAYQDFIEQIEPVVKPLAHRLNERLLALNGQYPLDPVRYEVHLRSARAAVELFVEKNVPIETQISLLSQEYQSVCGAMTVQFDGKERTLPEMGKFFLENDRSLRERAWRASSARRLQDKEKFEALFDKLRVLRAEVAANAGFNNFRDYQFKAYQRFDYAPDDCKAYHRAVKELIVPLRRAIDLKRLKDMKIDALRPWDGAVDPFGRQALKPFDDVNRLVSGVGDIFKELDPELSNLYEDMKGLGLLDLASRKGKAPGGYQNTLTEARKPFIFMNAVGIDDDVRTLLHESGHAFHAYLCARDPLDDYRHAPMEFCEVASMSMELMGCDGMRTFYDDEAARRSNIEHLEGVISTLAWVATVDAFQHWLYENPMHSAQDRRAAWERLHTEYGGGVVDWGGLEEERAFLWHRQLHIFEVPFYYIEYGIAQLGALQLWQKFRRDPSGALSDYKKGLSLGGSRPLPELFSAAGIRFDFSKEIIGPLMDDVYKAWEGLNR
ncbi:MAG: M3 family oligoendopeptidase [Candidatus Omnitrophica bacterium]|nr:M3 family oligoendopeptidase [Candidatus Omnitrophota bacterium]